MHEKVLGILKRAYKVDDWFWKEKNDIINKRATKIVRSAKNCYICKEEFEDKHANGKTYCEANPIQDGEGGQKGPPTSFSPITSTSVGISPKTF